MKEQPFREWLIKNGNNKKLQSDALSRLRAVQRELGNCDLDEVYKTDKCEKLLKALSKKGINDTMKEYGEVKLPIGKYTLAAYRYALGQYLKYKEEAEK